MPEILAQESHKATAIKAITLTTSSDVEVPEILAQESHKATAIKAITLTTSSEVEVPEDKLTRATDVKTSFRKEKP